MIGTLFIALVIGLIIGFIITYYILYLKNKSNTVAKSEYDILTNKLNENSTNLKLLEERSNSYSKTINDLNEKLDLKDNKLNELLNENAIFKTNLSNSNIKLSELSNELSIEKDNNVNLQKNINEQKEEIATLKANNQSLIDKLDTQKKEIEELHKSSQLHFEKIANQLLEEKTSKFTETNKFNIENILNPLKEDINKFKSKVEDTYDKETKQRISLDERIKQLVEQTNKVSSEANNLAEALKGSSKFIGDWGEIVLERILETSGLTKNREYFIQTSYKNETGANLRPDVVVKLPDDKNIVIDSKVSLIAYEKFVSAENDDEQKKYIQEHIYSTKKHIDDLSGKKYPDVVSAMDFTIMFVPIEPAYLVAIQNYRELWDYAYKKRVLLVSQTSLIFCLKLIYDLWVQNKQNKNAIEIFEKGSALYDKFAGFLETFEDIGKSIKKSQDNYDNALKKLKTGNGNLIKRSLDFKELGLKVTKEIPISMLPDDTDFEVENIEN